MRRSTIRAADLPDLPRGYHGDWYIVATDARGRKRILETCDSRAQATARAAYLSICWPGCDALSVEQDRFAAAQKEAPP